MTAFIERHIRKPIGRLIMSARERKHRAEELAEFHSDPVLVKALPYLPQRAGLLHDYRHARIRLGQLWSLTQGDSSLEPPHSFGTTDSTSFPETVELPTELESIYPELGNQWSIRLIRFKRCPYYYLSLQKQDGENSYAVQLHFRPGDPRQDLTIYDSSRISHGFDHHQVSDHLKTLSLETRLKIIKKVVGQMVDYYRITQADRFAELGLDAS
jgi:hypothetical protein